MKVVLTIFMLVLFNIFMTRTWYGHLKKGSAADDKPPLLIAMVSRRVAFFEYCFLIPSIGWGTRAV